MDEWLSQTKRLRKFLLSGQRQQIDKHQVIRTSENNDKFYYLNKGYAKRYLITNDGHIDVQSFYGPGYYFPLMTVFDGFFNQKVYNGPETYYYESMTDCEVFTVNIDKLVQSAEADPLLYKELLMIAGRRIEANIQQLENRALRNYHKRVAHQVTFFVEHFGNRHGNKAKLKIPLTQQDMADVLSTTRETVSLCMSDLKKKGIIKSGKFIVINNVRKLKEEAYQ